MYFLCGVTMTTTLNTSCSENTMVLSARRGVSACIYFLVYIYNKETVRYHKRALYNNYLTLNLFH